MLYEENLDVKMSDSCLPRPRDAISGTTSGLKQFGKGVGAGCAAAISSPILGAKEDGIRGCITGIGSGLVKGASSVVLGAVFGAVQVGRGIANTPSAIKGKVGGKVYDPKEGVWTENQYSLEKDYENISPSELEDQNPVGVNGREVVDMKLYDELQVGSDAGPLVIKKAYYQKALQYHPDKNPDDPVAEDKFKDICIAFDTLSNETKRKLYDLKGLDAVGLEPEINAHVFFSEFFGSEMFEPYLGVFRLATELKRSFTNETERVSSADCQTRRQVIVARNLREKTRDYVEMRVDVDEFRNNLILEFRPLTKAANGRKIMRVLARQYSNIAKQMTGNFFEQRVNRMKEKQNCATTQMSLANSALHSILVAQKIVKIRREDSDDEEEVHFDFDVEELLKNMPLFMGGLWKFTRLDIIRTIHRALVRIFQDKDCVGEIRKRQGEAIEIFAQVMEDCANEEEDEENFACLADSDRDEKSHVRSEIVKRYRNLRFKLQGKSYEQMLLKRRQEERERNKREKKFEEILSHFGIAKDS